MQLTRKTKSLESALSMSPDEIINRIKSSGLEGRGGANFPVGQKWEYARKAKSDKKILICNADEGEPGTFKDRYIIMNNSDDLVKGIIIASYAHIDEKDAKNHKPNIIRLNEQNKVVG